jgi:EAL domain-containing protein (putative c-di-GMP-specific phosphodiesterase class I)/GGDEF domain-containing protein
VKILARVRNAALRDALRMAAGEIGADLTEYSEGAQATHITHGDVIVAESLDDAELQELRHQSSDSGAAVLVACNGAPACTTPTLVAADEWISLPVQPDELLLRIDTARRRAARRNAGESSGAAAELLRYQELLFDRLTGFPTLPVMTERARELIETRGELTIIYIHFVWYEKVEEIYGWQRLDDVLETTANAVKEFYAREYSSAENLMMVSHIADDDFILFTQIPAITEPSERRANSLSQRLERFLRERIEQGHGEDIASLCGIYVGTSTVFRNPKIRTERLLYRGIREAAQAARGAEEWEKSQKVSDLKATLRDGAVFIEYHPIIVTADESVYGYEALARGVRRELRSPEILFEVAEEANLIWELSRLLRQRAVEGIVDDLKEGQFLFLNVDPHDFDDPSFRSLDPADLGISDPSKIVLEITERTAIKDYPRFQEYLAAFRKRGFRFAVDDAGSGYAGLGSIANLAPDYIKLDISLISNIDTNFLKQNLVETMVNFAEQQGAKVVAEGVERREEFETIKSLGVHLTQGFLFHKPRYAGLQR